MFELNKIHLIDAGTGSALLPVDFIDCIVTSIPYWSLRDYGVKGQIGLEDTPEQYVETIANIFDHLLRALKPGGTCWLNIGDTYLTVKGRSGSDRVDRSSGSSSQPDASKIGRKAWIKPSDRKHHTIKRKEAVGIPWMLAFELRRRGWYIRQEIIWHKPNAMPESAKDRCSRDHEILFLLTKSEKYYFDQEAIKVDASPNTHSRGTGRKLKPKESDRWGRNNDRWSKSVNDFVQKVNKRSVWSIANRPFNGAHFATFPEELVQNCILAGCPIEGVVLDPFSGAATTAMVAKKLERKYLGFEINPDYKKLGDDRILLNVGSIF